MRKKLMVVMGILYINLFFINLALAIPTFARKYRTSCNTCHVAYPKLNAFGESFRVNGFQIPEGDEAYIKEEPVSLGAPAWKKVWPEAVWPGTIPGPVPLSVRTIFDVNQNGKTNETRTQFDFPHEIEILMAGLLGKDIPFFAEVAFEGGATSTNAWLGFYNLFEGTVGQRALNLKIGNIALNPFPTANDDLRIGKNHYLYTWSFSSADSTNGFKLADDYTPAGVELNGIVASRLAYRAGIVNGNTAADKDKYVALRYKLGGTPFDRSAPNTPDALDTAVQGKASGFWVDNALELNLFSYFGRTNVVGNRDRFKRWGLGLRDTYENLSLTSGLILGENSDPYGSNSTEGASSQTWFVETSYVAYPWFIPVLRYETLDVSVPTDYAATNLSQGRFVPSLIFQIRPNVKLVAESRIYGRYKQSLNRPNDVSARLDLAY